MTALHEKVETVGTDAVQKFKASQLFIDSCANYYGTGFDDCLKQVALAFPELDLSKITMDSPEPTTPIGDIATDDDDDGSPKSQLPPKNDDVVVLTQPIANPPPAPVSQPLVVTVDVDDP